MTHTNKSPVLDHYKSEKYGKTDKNQGNGISNYKSQTKKKKKKTDTIHTTDCVFLLVHFMPLRQGYNMGITQDLKEIMYCCINSLLNHKQSRNFVFLFQRASSTVAYKTGIHHMGVTNATHAILTQGLNPNQLPE